MAGKISALVAAFAAILFNFMEVEAQDIRQMACDRLCGGWDGYSVPDYSKPIVDPFGPYEGRSGGYGPYKFTPAIFLYPSDPLGGIRNWLRNKGPKTTRPPRRVPGGFIGVRG